MTTFSFVEDYSSEDHEDVSCNYEGDCCYCEDDYCYDVLEEPLTLRSIHGTHHTIERIKVAPDSDPQVRNVVEASIVSLTPAPAMTVIESMTIPIHQRHEVMSLETFILNGYSNPTCVLQECRTIFKNWIQRFLYDLARLWIRFYRALGAVFRKPFAWATRKHE